MVPRDGLQESRIIKGLARGGTLKLLPVFFSFPHHGVPPKRLTNKLYERCHFSLRLAVLGARATAPSARLGREPISGLFSDQRKDVRSWAKSGLRSNPSLCPRSARSGHTPRWAQGPIEKDPMIRLPTGLCAGFCESAALISASTARRRGTPRRAILASQLRATGYFARIVPMRFSALSAAACTVMPSFTTSATAMPQIWLALASA